MADQIGRRAPAPATPPLVGRAQELAALRDTLAAALTGRGALVLIGGAAGIGKTTLAEVACAEAIAQGATVLVGRCYDLTETPPYGPWLDLLGRYAPEVGQPDLPPAFAARGDAGQVASQRALFLQVEEFFAALARHCPAVVLLLDDLHWADPASLDLLRFLSRGLDRHRLLLLATYRADELTRRHPLYQLLPTLVREARATRIDLRPLEDADFRLLAQRRYGLPEADEARLLAYLRSHAEGNPFYAGELLRTLEAESALGRGEAGWRLGDLAGARVPPLLRQLIDARVLRLGEAAGRLLAVAAVIGQEVPLECWERVAESSADVLLDQVERAVDAGLLVPTDVGVRFAHALIREALYEGLLPTRRRAWHRLAGETLAALPDPDPDAIAYHLRQAGDDRAVEWLIRAGGRAQRAYAWLTAAERLEAALALLEAREGDSAMRATLLLRLARLRLYGEPRRGLAVVDEAARLAELAGDRALAAYATHNRGVYLGQLGDLRQGWPTIAAGVAALEALPEADRARLAALGLDQVPMSRDSLVFWLAQAGRYAEVCAIGEPYVAAAPAPVAGTGIRSAQYANAYFALGAAHAALGRPDEARAAFARAADIFRAAGQHYPVASNALEALQSVALPYRADHPAERSRLADEGEEARRQAIGVLLANESPRLARLAILAIEGHWDEASLLVPAGQIDWKYAVRVLAPLARARGEADRAWAMVRAGLPRGLETEPGDTNFSPAVALQRVAAGLALDAGDLAATRAWIELHDCWLAWAGTVLWRAEGQLLWAQYHRAAGEATVAYDRAQRALAYAAAPRQPLALLAAHRLLGELDTVAGRHTDAQAHLDAALMLAEACAAPYERALTLLAVADLRRAAGDRDGAAGALDDARAILVPLGAAPALARADAFAARLTAPAPATPAAPPFGLTAREVEVLHLVAEGLTNAQVAARLFLSERTVHGHLRVIYSKLGVASRSAATRFALEHDLG